MCAFMSSDDLDPLFSTFNLVPLKLAYIRLRALVDQGVVFVGRMSMCVDCCV